MSLQLSNSYLKLEIGEPGEFYQGSRFDWTGQITQITFLDKYTFCTSESLDSKFQDIQGRGFYNEFGIDQPVGYNDCEIGEKFLKIGIGLLTRPDHEPYDFFKSYDITPGSFSSSILKDSAFFRFISPEHQSYSCILTKQIHISDASLSIQYELQNTGKAPIVTNEYVHNFISINGLKIGPSYRLSFPFKPDKNQFSAFVNPDNCLVIKDNEIYCKSVPQQDFFISSLQNRNIKMYWELINNQENAGIRELADGHVTGINLWGRKHVISPELFCEISVLPGQTIKWARFYNFFTLNNVKSG